MSTTLSKTWKQFTGIFRNTAPAARCRSQYSAKGQRRSRLDIETLEDRRLLANYLIVDFTPDALPNEYRNATFAQAFQMRDAGGRALSFLDMNGDRVVNSTDVNLAAQRIVNRVAQYFRGQNITVYGGDLGSDTSWGRSWLNYGLRSATDQVFVVYDGGWNSVVPGAPARSTGVAIQAPVGYNNEWYAFAWSSQIAYNMATIVPPAARTPSYFVELNAWSIAHEGGHLMGLGHVAGNPQSDPGFNLMNYSTGGQPNLARIPNLNYNYNIELYTATGAVMSNGSQNPAMEVSQSLRGQALAPAQFRRAYATNQPVGYAVPVHFSNPMTATPDEDTHDPSTVEVKGSQPTRHPKLSYARDELLVELVHLRNARRNQLSGQSLQAALNLELRAAATSDRD